jgi:hypothetical protein
MKAYSTNGVIARKKNKNVVVAIVGLGHAALSLIATWGKNFGRHTEEYSPTPANHEAL